MIDARETKTLPDKCGAINAQINRLNKRSLNQLLLSKFLREYGYEKGIVAARALVADIVETTDQYYAKANRLRPGQMAWLAICKDDRPAKGKTLDYAEWKPIHLTLFAPEDVGLIKNKYSCFVDMQKQRAVRLVKEAYQQKAVLSMDDLSMLLAKSYATVSRHIREYQKNNNELLPTRGNVADLGPGITHKKQIVELHVQGMLTPEIARKTNHSRRSVDRYISDFERIKTLNERNFSAEEISQLTRRGVKVVREYLKILKKFAKI